MSNASEKARTMNSPIKIFGDLDKSSFIRIVETKARL